MRSFLSFRMTLGSIVHLKVTKDDVRDFEYLGPTIRFLGFLSMENKVLGHEGFQFAHRWLSRDSGQLIIICLTPASSEVIDG